MRNALKFLIAGTLITGTVVAQEQSESVEGILKELGNYSVKAPSPAAAPVEIAPAVVTPVPAKIAPTPVAVAPVAVVPVAVVEATPVSEPAATTAEVAPAPKKASKGWFWNKADKETTPVEEEQPVEIVKQEEIPQAAMEALDVPATLEASRELYTGGEFEKAQRGFEAVIKKDPENIIARMYLRKLVERDARLTEVQSMKDVRGEWKTGLVLRSYDISAEALTKMGLENIADAADVAAKFPEVDFPKGSSAVYQPKAGKLYVRNTFENLAVLEEILDAMDVAKHSSGVDQVEIEAKFVEVSEGTLEQLGFEWNFQNSVKTGIEGGDVIANDGNGLFADTLRGSSQSPALPFSQTSALGAGETSASGDWSAFRFEDTFNTEAASLRLENNGSKPLDVLISALDQSSGTDVLSAPRIVTKSGKKATIRVGQLHYFPEVYEVGGNEGNIIHVKYQDFSEKLLGVELEVTPKVDGDQITMGLNPKVSELLGWQNYQIAPANSAYSYYQFGINQQFNHDAIVARLPIFKRREIKTEVTIADGSTMGMGGLINEKIESYEDKVPVLGSLPLIGRLFRSEGERAVKRNLMIFVTAKKVEPTGRINTARSFE
jgi:type II secretory pathway component GspD/PulD (secretin)